jgi:hypothetical protein
MTPISIATQLQPGKARNLAETRQLSPPMKPTQPPTGGQGTEV